MVTLEDIVFGIISFVSLLSGYGVLVDSSMIEITPINVFVKLVYIIVVCIGIYITYVLLYVLVPVRTSAIPYSYMKEKQSFKPKRIDIK